MRFSNFRYLKLYRNYVYMKCRYNHFQWANLYSIYMQTEIQVLRVHLQSLNSKTASFDTVTATLRVGKNTAFATHKNSSPSDHIPLNLPLQLNLDKQAFSTQRCTVTLTNNQGSIIGVAIVSIPRQQSGFRKTVRLVQTKDKIVDLSMSIKILSLEEANNKQNTNGDQKDFTPAKISKISIKASLNKVKSNPHLATERTARESLLDQEETVESEFRRLRKEKEAYYQLYQLQKAKSQKAADFISSLVVALSGKYPDLVQNIEPSLGPLQRKKMRQNRRTERETATIQHLQQANRSLHRQLEQYKVINQKLKVQLFGKTSTQTNLIPSSGLCGLLPFKSTNKGRISNILSPVKSQLNPSSSSQLAEVDLKKWLQQSVGQREQLKKHFQMLPKQVYQARPQMNLVKVKSAINKAYLTLISRGNFTRESIMSHKRQVLAALEQ